jgi:hypothetical protein
MVVQFRMFRVSRKVNDAIRRLRHGLQELHDPYRPELHYMRGPGPKWREKHRPGPAPVEAGIAGSRIAPAARPG